MSYNETLYSTLPIGEQFYIGVFIGFLILAAISTVILAVAFWRGYDRLFKISATAGVTFIAIVIMMGLYGWMVGV